jgi:hypothetical protein
MYACTYLQYIYIYIAAKDEYANLRRELSAVSRVETRPSTVEEGKAQADEFDLDEFLHGISRAREENGAKDKNLGVSWKNLHVEVKLIGEFLFQYLFMRD